MLKPSCLGSEFETLPVVQPRDSPDWLAVEGTSPACTHIVVNPSGLARIGGGRCVFLKV